MNPRAKHRVCLGAFAGAHGVKGDVKVKSFAENAEDISSYGPLESEDGDRRFTLTILRALKGDLLLARADEIKSREDAEDLKGVRLYVDRTVLPELSEDEFYLEDLVGLNAVDESGAPLGAVSAVYNFGAGDILELKDIPGVKAARLIAFTKQNAPAVDVAGGVITIARAAITASDEDPTAQPANIDAAMGEEEV